MGEEFSFQNAKNYRKKLKQQIAEKGLDLGSRIFMICKD